VTFRSPPVLYQISREVRITINCWHVVTKTVYFEDVTVTVYTLVLLMTILFLKGTYTLFAGGDLLFADRIAEPPLDPVEPPIVMIKLIKL